MFHYVYLLESKTSDKLYIGYTKNLEKRLKEHNKGRNTSTSKDTPWEIIHCEAYRNQADALRREKYLKTNQGARLLKRMLKEYFYNKKTNGRISTTR